MMKTEFSYQGFELELFRDAVRWKNYVAGKIRKFISGRVLEVGAGPGNFTGYLMNENVINWTCIEPDSNFASLLASTKNEYPLPVEVVNATIGELPEKELFHSILYLDVLEHIEEDTKEVEMMISHLEPGGFIIILCPAFNFVFSPFDKQIGHYRRYTKKTLLKLFPDSVRIITARYLDSIGLMASVSNRFFLRQSYPDKKQIRIWDKFMVPVSTFTDHIFSPFFGRSILVIAQKPLPE